MGRPDGTTDIYFDYNGHSYAIEGTRIEKVYIDVGGNLHKDSPLKSWHFSLGYYNLDDSVVPRKGEMLIDNEESFIECVYRPVKMQFYIFSAVWAFICATMFTALSIMNSNIGSGILLFVVCVASFTGIAYNDYRHICPNYKLKQYPNNRRV